MKIALIRHSITAGNLARQYIGSTDQPLCEQGIALARRASAVVPPVQRVLCSPMLRARQTAALLYPKLQAEPVAGLQECDFGVYEGKTHEELNTLTQYREWIASGGRLPPPGGEAPDAFLARCRDAFLQTVAALEAEKTETAAFVLHGGSIMSLMYQLAAPKRDFYGWQTHNCTGFLCERDADGSLRLLEEICPEQ